MPMKLEWPFIGPAGRVSDWGGPQVVVDEEGQLLFVIPRYGVWKADGSGRLVVTHTCADLAEARRLAGG